jgi:N-acetylneuraminate synthase
MINFKNIKTPYFIAEVGINHNGDVQIAKRLIDSAFAAKWDCVKFQKREPDISVPEAQKKVIRETPWGKMTYLDYKKRMEFGKKEYDYIDQYCKEKPIDWTASVWDLPSLEFILNYKVPFIKIPSAKLTDRNLLKEAAKSGAPLVVSTGMSTLSEIDRAVEILNKYKTRYVLLHCNSAYPAPRNELNVRCIQTLQKRYKQPIGYSGHEYDAEPTVFAAVLGAKIIERHITLDHNLWGTDQAASLELTGMDRLRRRVMTVDQVLGNGKKIVTEQEKSKRKQLRGV